MLIVCILSKFVFTSFSSTPSHAPDVLCRPQDGQTCIHSKENKPIRVYYEEFSSRSILSRRQILPTAGDAQETVNIGFLGIAKEQFWITADTAAGFGEAMVKR